MKVSLSTTPICKRNTLNSLINILSILFYTHTHVYMLYISIYMYTATLIYKIILIRQHYMDLLSLKNGILETFLSVCIYMCVCVCVCVYIYIYIWVCLIFVSCKFLPYYCGRLHCVLLPLITNRPIMDFLAQKFLGTYTSVSLWWIVGSEESEHLIFWQNKPNHPPNRVYISTSLYPQRQPFS